VSLERDAFKREDAGRRHEYGQLGHTAIGRKIKVRHVIVADASALVDIAAPALGTGYDIAKSSEHCR
jgi:hypothetical protein